MYLYIYTIFIITNILKIHTFQRSIRNTQMFFQYSDKIACIRIKDSNMFDRRLAQHIPSIICILVARMSSLCFCK